MGSEAGTGNSEPIVRYRVSIGCTRRGVRSNSLAIAFYSTANDSRPILNSRPSCDRLIAAIDRVTNSFAESRRSRVAGGELDVLFPGRLSALIPTTSFAPRFSANTSDTGIRRHFRKGI